MVRRVLKSAVLLGLSVAGCTPPTSPDKPEVTSIAVGEVDLGTATQGAVVRLEDLSGNVLATGTSNLTGLVFFHEVVLPADFRAVAQPPGTNEEFAAELRDFDPSNQRIRITLLTTLTSRYLRMHPELSLDEAQSRLKAALDIPEIVDPVIGISEPSPFFSDIEFWQTAGRGGGWVPFTQSLLDQLGQGQAQSFLLTQADLDTPVAGLESALAPIAELARTRLQARLATGHQALNQGEKATRSPSIALLEGPSTLHGQFLLGTTTGVVGNTITFGVLHAGKAVFGWAANQLGLNYGTTGQLQEIEATLNQIDALLESLDTEVKDANLEQQLSALNTDLAPVQSANTSLQSALIGANITNEPFSPPPNLATLIGDVTSPDYATVLTDVQGGLQGSSKAIMSAVGIAMNQGLGVDTPGSVQSMPWRNNYVLFQLLNLYNYYATEQTVALNLYSEQAHNYTVNPDPVLGVNQFLPNLQKATSALKTQRQQLPFPLTNSDVLVDYENGIMWIATMQAPCTFGEANATAQSLVVGLYLPDGTQVIYDDWRLPTYGECLALQNRGKYCNQHDPNVPVNSNNAYPDTGQATSGLPALGFFNVAEALTAANNGSSNGSNGDMWMAYYTYDYKSIPPVFFQSQWEFRLNHESSNLSYENNSSDTNVFLMCRTFGSSPVVTPYAGSNTSSSPPPTDPGFGSSFTAGELAQFGVPTAIDLLPASVAPSTLSFNTSAGPVSLPIPENSLQFDAEITYQVSIGGTFATGYQTTQSFTNPVATSMGTVSTLDRGTGLSNLLGQLIAWGTTDAFVHDIMNTPGLDGIAIPHQTQPADITATLLGAGGTTITGTLSSYTAPAISPHTLQSLQISPRNQVYGATNTQPSSGSFPYYCTGFYADGTIATLGPNLNWSVAPTSNPAHALITVTGAGPTLQLNQPAQAAPAPYNLTITATTADGSLSDSTTIQIVPPVQ